MHTHQYWGRYDRLQDRSGEKDKSKIGMKDSSSSRLPFQTIRILVECCCWTLLFLIYKTPEATAAEAEPDATNWEDETTNLEAWQRCDYFVAPTKNMGWGVFAGRSFAKDEIVSLPTTFLPLQGNPKAVQNTVLDDYIYGVEGLPGLVPGFHSNVLFGPEMIYNHSPEPNLLTIHLGISTGFAARRDIREGEELFNDYGNEWFEKRNIEMEFVDNQTTNAAARQSDELSLTKHSYCSKIKVGLGTKKKQHLLQSRIGIDHVDRFFGAPFDAGFEQARAKVPIAKGERIELAVALAIHANKLEESPIGALVIRWNDFTGEHQQVLRTLRESGKLQVQTQSPDTNWKRVDEGTMEWQDLTILPISGGLINVQRVEGHASGNCRLVIKPEFSQPGSVTVILELIATKDIALGQLLAMGDIWPRVGPSEEEGLLYKALLQTGQLEMPEGFALPNENRALPNENKVVPSPREISPREIPNEL